MPKSMRKGITAIHVCKESDARIYSGTVIGSTVTLRRAADGWRVIGFVSAWVSGQQRGKLQLRISPAQDAAAAKAIRAACGIIVTRAVAGAAHIARERPKMAQMAQPRSRPLK